MSRYASLLDLRDYLSSDGLLGTINDGLLQDSLDGAESVINDYTRRNFAGTAGTIYINRYSANKVRNQAMYLEEDLHTLVSITNGDGANIPVGSAWLEPRNSGPPYRIVRLKSSNVWVWNTDSDVMIAGTLGFSTIAPAAIVRSTVRLAAWMYRAKDLGIGDSTGMNDAGEVQYPQGMPQDVKQALAPYRSRSGGVV